MIRLDLITQPQIEIGQHSSITVFGFTVYTDTLIMILGVVEFIDGLVIGTIGEPGRQIAPLVVTMFIFILISNWIGLVQIPGIHFTSPTADLNSTLALALVTFIGVQFYAFRTRGFLGYFKHYLEPIPFLAPINIIEELSKPITLSFRLFGNILAGEVMLLVLSFF